MLPCGIFIVRASLMDRLVALEMASMVGVLVLMLFAQGFGQPSFFDLALASALLAFPGGLAFCRFLERL
jgi:multisubunit Na+/H+ antiporter MnhF subunit